MRYRFPVRRRSCEISASGASVAVAARTGSALAQRVHWTATARFHVPQSGQNRALSSELEADEIVGRPGAAQHDLDPGGRLRFRADGFRKLAPA
jgi:hypothetical protein